MEPNEMFIEEAITDSVKIPSATLPDGQVIDSDVYFGWENSVGDEIEFLLTKGGIKGKPQDFVMYLHTAIQTITLNSNERIEKYKDELLQNCHVTIEALYASEVTLSELGVKSKMPPEMSNSNEASSSVDPDSYNKKSKSNS